MFQKLRSSLVSNMPGFGRNQLCTTEKRIWSKEILGLRTVSFKRYCQAVCRLEQSSATRTNVMGSSYLL
ncbi:hypothetical protein DXA98_00615 [Lachnospiraceae bacterium OF09-6]|nr:hypothetical protein DXA98_00615 [Lachnospiraceae bacterium OF09-6]